MDKVALGQISTEYFGFPCQFAFHRLLTIIIIYHLGLVQQASSGRSTKWTHVSVTP
jgi:hypothetical protein